MNRLPRIAICFLALLMLTGCWNKFELTEWGFVQAVAIDQADNNRIHLTTHFYKPGGGVEGPQRSSEGFSVRSKGDNMSQAIANITNSMGRVPQWSHMRMVLISEEMAKDQQLKGIIDYFMRDHETRDTLLILITKGQASDYLKQKPYIESTIGQQLREMNQSSNRFTGNTNIVNMLQAAIQLKSQSGVMILPYLTSGEEEDQLSMSGLAIIRNYSIVEPPLSPTSTQFLLMLRNEYEHGVLSFPCEGDKLKRKDTFEHVTVHSSTKVEPRGETVAVKINLALQGSYGELRCTTVLKPSDEDQVAEEIRKMLERGFRKTFTLMQSKQLDLLNIGDALYRKHPALWRKWKSNWGERLSQASFELNIDIKMTNTGLTRPKPYGQ